jgi:hypothetical protein
MPFICSGVGSQKFSAPAGSNPQPENHDESDPEMPGLNDASSEEDNVSSKPVSPTAKASSPREATPSLKRHVDTGLRGKRKKKVHHFISWETCGMLKTHLENSMKKLKKYETCSKT